MNFGIENPVARKRCGGAFWFLIPLATLLVGMQSLPAWAQADQQLSAIIRDGSALTGRASVDISGITTGFETLPTTKIGAPTGAITYNTELDGSAWNAAPLNVNILVNTTSTVDARNGAILSSINTPGTTALVFSYDIFDVDLSAINLSGAALTGGRATISLPGLTTGFDAMPATAEASTKFGQSFTSQLDGNAEGGGTFNLLFGKTTTLDATTDGIVSSVNSTIPTETKLVLRYPVFTMSLAASDRAGNPLTTGSPEINIAGVTAGSISLGQGPFSVETYRAP
jgi:hypothetical protein